MKKKKPVVGFANQKGGVGKTTSTKTFSEFCAIVKKKNTLDIDFDSQMSLTARHYDIIKDIVSGYRLTPKHPEGNFISSIADIFYGKIPSPYPTKYKHLDIIPANEESLLKVDDVKKHDIAERIYMQLHNFINLPDVQSSYDIFCIDLPPAKNILTVTAFKALTHLVIPIEIEMQSLEGLTGLMQLWKQEAMLRSPEHPLHLVGILPNKVHTRRSIDQDLLVDLRNDPGFGDYVLPVHLTDRKEIPECDFLKKSIFEYPASNAGRIEASKVCDYLYKRVIK